MMLLAFTLFAADTKVTPTATGAEKKLVDFQGTWFDKGQSVPYSQPGFERKEMDIDAELIKDLVDDLTSANSDFRKTSADSTIRYELTENR